MIGSWMMGPWLMWGWGWMGLGAILFIVLIGIGIYLLAIARERYARGDITKEEYDEIYRDLSRS